MYISQSPYTHIAVSTIQHYFQFGQIKGLKINNVPEELYGLKRGCFVSLHKNNHNLRGCIGTIEPQEDNLVEEIKRNAFSAAFNDHRFSPLTEDEFRDIHFSVDVLTVPEEISSFDELDPLIYGLIVSDGSFRRGVLLPSIPGVDSVEQQIQIARQKAGLSLIDDNKLIYHRFTSNRYN